MSPITTGNFPKDLKGKRPMTPAKKAAAGVKKERFERMISGKGPARGAKPVKKAPGMGDLKGKRPMTPAKKAAAGVKKERFERMISGKGPAREAKPVKSPARGAKPVKKAPGMGGIGRVVAAKRSRKAAMDKIMKGW